MSQLRQTRATSEQAKGQQQGPVQELASAARVATTGISPLVSLLESRWPTRATWSEAAEATAEEAAAAWAAPVSTREETTMDRRLTTE